MDRIGVISTLIFYNNNNNNNNLFRTKTCTDKNAIQINYKQSTRSFTGMTTNKSYQLFQYDQNHTHSRHLSRHTTLSHS